MARVSTGKAQRFRIFARDGFTCRYCGCQSDTIPLHVDHVIPVSQGGTNDDDNLITSCRDCNLGKGAKLIQETQLPDFERLRMAQERNEQMTGAQAALNASKARSDLRSVVSDYFCAARGKRACDPRTLNTLVSYVNEFGADVVFDWIDKACVKLQRSSDGDVGRYISGIRRCVMKEGSIQ